MRERGARRRGRQGRGSCLVLGAGARQAHGLEGAQPDLVGAKRQMRRGAVPEKVLLQAWGWGSGRPESRESAGQARGSVHAAPPGQRGQARCCPRAALGARLASWLPHWGEVASLWQSQYKGKETELHGAFRQQCFSCLNSGAKRATKWQPPMGTASRDEIAEAVLFLGITPGPGHDRPLGRTNEGQTHLTLQGNLTALQPVWDFGKAKARTQSSQGSTHPVSPRRRRVTPGCRIGEGRAQRVFFHIKKNWILAQKC